MSEKIIPATWARIEQKMWEQAVLAGPQTIARTAFAAGLYAASAAVTLERADAQEISEAAYRIEALP